MEASSVPAGGCGGSHGTHAEGGGFVNRNPTGLGAAARHVRRSADTVEEAEIANSETDVVDGVQSAPAMPGGGMGNMGGMDY